MKKIEYLTALVIFHILDCCHMALGKVGNMDAVTNAGTVVGAVVVAVNA